MSVLVPDIFRFEKCVKYANDRTDDAIEQNDMGGDVFDYCIRSRELHAVLSDYCLTSYNLGSIVK